jgi:fucose 4-O-acetylase-like acetyltransferase
MYNNSIIKGLQKKWITGASLFMKKNENKAEGFIARAFNLPYLQTNRHRWIDYLKGIAIILVVYRHSLIGIERTHTYIPEYLTKANMIFYSFRMPLFFILSGLFITSSFAKRTFKQLVTLKFKALLYPYLIWTVLQITAQIFVGHYTNASRSLIDYTYIFYQPRELDQFWYLPALFNVSLVYLLIKSKINPPAWVQILVGLVLYFLSSYIRNISMISDWMEFYIFFAIGDAASKLFFNEKVQRILKSPWLLLAITPAFVLLQLYYLKHPESYFQENQVGRIEFIGIALLGCFSMFILAFRMQSWNVLSFLRLVGYHSLYIYVMHVFIEALTRIVLMKVFMVHNPLILLLSGIFTSITCCIMFYNLLIKNNILWFLFYMKKPKATAAE